MGNNSNNWKFLKNFNKCKKSRPPDRLNYNGKIITNPYEISNIANNYFISKVEKIRRNFKRDNISPIEILENLIPKSNTTFHIPPITIAQTIEIVDKIPNSSTTGHDDINNEFIKKIKHIVAPHITHLINTILLTKKFPFIYKITRVLPLSKISTDTNFIENYRPISNLCCIEKIIEHYILFHLESYFNQNNLLNDNLHGGRKFYSTFTAITNIYHQLFSNKEQNFTSAILSTDLSACYDTIDTEILLKKMNHYGITQEWNDFFRSFLNDRRQFVRLDTKILL